jgi:signal transduction histidine kinase
MGSFQVPPHTSNAPPSLRSKEVPTQAHNKQLAKILRWIAVAAFLIAIAEFIASIQLSSGLLVLGAGLAVAVGVLMLLSADALDHGAERRGAAHLTLALIAVAAAYTIVLPGGAASLSLLPVVIVAVLLPFIKKPLMKRTLVASWAAGFLIVTVNILWHPPTLLPEWFTIAFRVAAFAGVLAVALSILYNHHQRLSTAAEQARADARALQASDQAKTRFLNTAAHELRTPLTPVLIQLELMRQHPGVVGDPKLQHSTTVIQRNINRLKAHVDDLLDIARLQTGRLPLKMQEMPIDPLLLDAEESFQELTKTKGLRLDVRGAPGTQVRADPNRLMQVLFNLLSNAVKATPDGGRIVIAAECEDTTCNIHVTDTGNGIKKEDLARLFEPFEQLTDEEHQKDGAGLGLFISRNIVEAHGGTIRATSEGPGKGSTFTITLPTARRPSTAAQGDDKKPPGRQTPKGRHAPEQTSPTPGRTFLT